MKTVATRSRLMQFEAGPAKTRMYACDAHEDQLYVPSMCHLPVFTEPVTPEDPEEELSCDFCREGG